MSEQMAAKRYAEAIYEIGLDTGELTLFAEQFNVVKAVFQKDSKLKVFMNSPRIAPETKQKAVSQAFAGLHPDILNALMLLIERRRTSEIPAIADELERRRRDAAGIAKLEVISVKQLDQTKIEELTETFKKRLGKQQIEIETIIDPSLIGGLKIRVGNTIYDGSVQNKLKRLERQIRTMNH